MQSTWRDSLLAAVILCGMTSVCFSRLIEHPTDILVGPHNNGENDATRHVLAFRPLPLWTIQRFGEWPMWNPWSMAGVPHLGNPQSGMFYPPNLLYCLLPSTVCANWLVFFHHWWAGFGVYLLMRHWGCTWFPACFSGLSFLGAPYMMAQTCEGHVSQVCLMAWSPWLWLSYEHIRNGIRGGVPATAFILSMAFFCGHIQELFYWVLIFSGFAVWDASPLRKAGVTAINRRSSLNWFAAGGWTAGLVLVEFVPIWNYLRHAARASGISVAQASQGSLNARSFWQLLDPFAYGGPQHSMEQDSYFWGTYWESIFYFGIGPLLLSLFALCNSIRYPKWRLIVIVVLAILFSFGDDTPVFPWLHQLVPGIGMFRAPMRALFHASFAISLLAGFGVQEILTIASDKAQQKVRNRTKIGGTVGITITGILLAWSLAGWTPFETFDSERWPQVRWPLPFFYAFCICSLTVVCIRTPGSSHISMSMLLLVNLIDLGIHSRMVTRTVPLRAWDRPNPILSRITNQLGWYRISAPQLLVSDREAWKAGVAKIEAYEPVPLANWGQFYAGVFPGEDPARTLTGFTPMPLNLADSRLLNQLSVRYAVVAGHDHPTLPGWKLIERGVSPLETYIRAGKWQGVKYSLFENLNALPRAFVAHSEEPKEDLLAHSDDALPREIRAGTVVHRPPPVFGLDRSECQIEFIRPSHIRLHATLPRPGLVLMSDFHYPGWRATVNGEPRPIERANQIFRAVRLGAGTHVVEMRYRPTGFILGCSISAIAWIIWILMTAPLLKDTWTCAKEKLS